MPIQKALCLDLKDEADEERSLLLIARVEDILCRLGCRWVVAQSRAFGRVGLMCSSSHFFEFSIFCLKEGKVYCCKVS